MCEILWLPKALVWSFVIAALALALVSRKLNDHLLTLPDQPSGPFAVLFRRKYHVRLSYLCAPARHFDAAGQRWVKLFVGLLAAAVLLFALLTITVQGCNWKFGG